MTRGAAANAILDAGRSKKRLPSPPPPSLFLPGLRYNLSVFLPTTLSLVVRPPLLLTRGGLFPLSLLSFLALHAFARAPPPPSFCLFILSRPLVPSLSHSLRSSLSLSLSLFASFFCLLLLSTTFPCSLYPERRLSCLSSCPMSLSVPPSPSTTPFFLFLPAISLSLSLFLSLSLSLPLLRILRRLPSIAALSPSPSSSFSSSPFLLD